MLNQYDLCDLATPAHYEASIHNKHKMPSKNLQDAHDVDHDNRILQIGYRLFVGPQKSSRSHSTFSALHEVQSFPGQYYLWP